ncbi:MAG: phosphatase PAP2 family protein [Terrimesophilobacter sp.]
MEERTARTVSRRWPLISGVTAVTLAVALGLLIFVREKNLPFGFDTAWMEEIVEHRNPVWEAPSLVMNFLGGGWFAVFVVPLVVVVLLLAFRRYAAALYFTVAVLLSVGTVQLLKQSLGRPRPLEILVTSDTGAFPSGHVANAATLAVVLGVILRRGWVWAAGIAYTVLMMLSRTYLGAHWASDTIGGALVGAGVAVIVWAPFALRLERER